MYTLIREQALPVPVERVWAFISKPDNLNRITPEKMGFEVLSDLPEIIYPGLLIEYRIRLPLLGLRHWTTEITQIVPGISFVDEQRFGPYKFWHHYHEVEARGGQSIMRDRVSYMLPFGPFGRMVHAGKVREMLEEIFTYREQTLAKIFGQSEGL